MTILTRYKCGHVGRTALLHEGFIRVAEIRKNDVKDVDKPCPECRHNDNL